MDSGSCAYGQTVAARARIKRHHLRWNILFQARLASLIIAKFAPSLEGEGWMGVNSIHMLRSLPHPTLALPLKGGGKQIEPHTYYRCAQPWSARRHRNGSSGKYDGNAPG
jgi:hypothetical protein